MFDELISRWWIVAARGFVAVVFGVAAFLAPQWTLAVLVSFFGLFALADAAFTIGAALSLNWLSLFLEGVAGGAVGLLTLFYPPAAEMWFVYMIMAWAFLTGALELMGAVKLRAVVNGPMVEGEWLLGASGVLSLLFGVAVALLPGDAGVAFVWTLASYAILSGGLMLALAFNVRTWRPAALTAAAA